MSFWTSLRREWGVARSIHHRFRINHGRWRDPLLAQFVRPGDLVFDVGAHVGDCIASLRRLGARVVAVEPQPALHRALRFLHGHDPQVMLERVALGECCGQTELHLNLSNPTVTSASSAFIDAAAGAAGWHGQRWEQAIQVPMTTLDRMIAHYGVPSFCKIDVEGFEIQVLRGLSEPLAALSFEFTTIQRAVAAQAIQLCERLGDYHYNASLGASGRLEHASWVDARALVAWLECLPHAANAGDIYALRR
ncbi:MAG: FkbM family methyltransferase [Gammaproteobacteria bacterium]|nr:FkbM family methyltransferase [Gammaproteobacteria bacterium]